MKRKITVGELERLYKGRKPGRFLFDAEDQEWNRVGSPIRFHMEFKTLQVSKNPDIILLRNGVDYVYFQKVRHIIVDDEKSLLGTVLHIICETEANDGSEIRYTLVDTQTDRLV